MATVERPPSILRTLRGLTPPLWMLLIGTFINKMGTFLQFYLVLYLTGRGFGEYAAGFALGAWGLGCVVGVLVGGAVCDRIGVRATITLSMAGAGVLTAVLVHLSSIGLIVVTTAFIGLLAQFYRPASSVLLVALTPREQHVMVFAVYRLAFNLGSTAGPLLGALLITHSYELLFYVEAATLVLFALVALRLPGAEATSGTAGTDEDETRGSYLTVARDRRYLLYLLAVFLYSAVYIQHLAALPLQVRADGLSPAFYAALLSTNAVLIIAFELPLTTRVQRLRPGVAVGIGILFVGVGMNINAAGPAAMFVVAMLVWTAGEMIASPTVLAYPGQIAPPTGRGRYVAASAFAMQIGFAVGPPVGVALWTASSQSVWWACSIVGFAGAAAAILGMTARAGAGSDGDETPVADAVPAGGDIAVSGDDSVTVHPRAGD